MKKTITSILLACSAIVAQADQLWQTNLSTTGSNPSDAVVETSSQIMNSISGTYDGGWRNDFGNTYDLKFAEDHNYNHVFGAYVGTVDDIGFVFDFSDIEEEIALDSINLDVFSWTMWGADYKRFNIRYVWIQINHTIVQEYTCSDLPVYAEGTTISIPLDHVGVFPGDKVQIIICVSATDDAEGFGISRIIAEGEKG